MGNVTLRDGSKLSLKDDSALTIKGIEKIKNIDPVAVHIKEVNHIDPLSIEAVHVNEVKNIDPLQIDRFNVTNLPTVNMRLHQLPTIDMNLRSLPPISVGTYQDFCIPSNYTLRARLLGVELVRLHLDGQTSIIPKQHTRREQARTANRSFPVTSTAGNPAIPSTHTETTCPAPHETISHAHCHHAPPAKRIKPGVATATCTTQPGEAALSFGTPRMSFQIPEQTPAQPLSENRVMSGE